MERLISVRCENNNKIIKLKPGTSLLELLDMLHLKAPYKFIAAYVNNKSKDLNYVLYENKTVKFIDVTHYEGSRVYHRTMFFILYKTIKDLYPDRELKIEHSIARGFYFTIEGICSSGNDTNMCVEMKKRMSELISQDIPIVYDRYYYEDAREIFRENDLKDKLKLLTTRNHLYVTVYQMADVYGYFYGTLAPSTGYMGMYDIIPFYDGFYLSLPHRTRPDMLEVIENRDKIFDVFKRHKEWNNILNVSNIGSLNTMILENKSSQLIKIGEALQENLFANVANIINSRFNSGVKMVLISGPSSSGKTTFSNRLNIQLSIFGLKPIILSMDNYFVNRADTPLDENGDHDFESINALDLKLFNEHLNALIKGEEIDVPKFDFHHGMRLDKSSKMVMDEKSILIIEGIHALNPVLTVDVPQNNKYKVYVSALTSISMDNLSRISTTDNRLLRRMVRDSKYRNHTATQTLKRWGSVREGEEKYIFPYQEEADYMFNSSLFFELSVLKRYAEPLLLTVPDTESVYSEARRILSMLDFFLPMDDTQIPPTSIVREFIGGSSFQY